METFKILNTATVLPDEINDYIKEHNIPADPVKVVYKFFKGSNLVDQVIAQVVIDFDANGFFDEFKFQQ